MSILNIPLLCRWSKRFPKLSPFDSWPGAMTNAQSFELPISRINFYSPKDVRVTEILLYFLTIFTDKQISINIIDLFSTKTYVYSLETPHWGASNESKRHIFVQKSDYSCWYPSYLGITKTRLFKYVENFTSKNWKFSDKKLWYFSYFCSKHRLWVLVRTASARRF